MRKDKIFVTIACYRDPVIQSTIDDLFCKSDFPENISVGVFIQELEKESPLITNTFDEKVKVTSQIPGNIFSVCECRNKAFEHYNGEKYTLQIDSHTRFDQSWDTSLLNMYSSLKNEKTLLSIYLPEWYLINDEEHTIPRIDTFGDFSFNNEESKNAFFTYNEFVPFPTEFVPANGETLRKSWYLCGHFIFGNSEFFQTVTQPEWVGFWGEELINSLRAFTSGWDVYIPSTPPLYHMHEEKSVGFSRPKLWIDFPIQHSDKRVITTNRIINTIQNKTLSKDDLFDARNLNDLYSLIGYDLGTLFNGWVYDK